MKECITNNADLPRGWIWTNVDNILLTLQSGGRPKGGVRGIKEGIPSVGGEHLLYNGGFNFDELRYVPQEFYRNMSRGKIQKYDVLVVKDGATTGKTAFVSDSFPFSEAAVNEHVFILRVPNLIEAKYLFYWMQSPFGQKCVKENFQGTAQGGINSSFTKNSKFPLAPLPEQVRITAKVELLFSFLDAGVAQLRLVQGQLKRYRQAVLKAAFEGKLTQQWRKEQKDQLEPAQQLLERIIKAKEETSKTKFDNQIIINGSEKHLELPVSWVWTKLGKIISVHSGEGLTTRQMQKDGQYPVYGGNGVSGHYSKYLFEDSRVIIGRVGAKCGVVHITAPKSWVTDNALVVDTWYMNLKFLYYSLSNLNLNQFSVSTAQPVISSTKIYPLNFKLPPLMEQEQIVREIEYRLSIADETNKLNLTIFKQADKLRQCVLKSAFEGRLVPQNPADEPAERLLERIKAQQLTRKSKNNNQVELSKYVK